MRSERNKVLHTLLGRPVVAYPVGLARDLQAQPVVAVLGHQKDAVAAALDSSFGAGAIAVAHQETQKGTGHAVKVGLTKLRGFKGIVLILVGDAPLLTRKTLTSLARTARRTEKLCVLTAHLDDPTGYGRITRNARGGVTGIVEHRDCTEAQRAIGEVNAGMYAVPIEFLRRSLSRLSSRNAQGELYLTDIVSLAASSIGVTAVVAAPEEILGINNRRQLIQAEESLRARIAEAHLAQATLRDPSTTWIDPEVTIAKDADIGPHVTLRGTTRIGKGAVISQGCILTDTTVGPGALIRPYCVTEKAEVGAGNKIGPFAHLRPGTVLSDNVHVGNFVETKKTTLGTGSKANHLTYLGDATVGDGVNIGAGTITCNYNGYEKRQTVIGDGAFVGSDSQLVAPVKVGAGAVVAAGTTVTKEVPAGALALSRTEQKQVPGYAERVAERYQPSVASKVAANAANAKRKTKRSRAATGALTTDKPSKRQTRTRKTKTR